MARIKIGDIPKDQQISKDELKRIRGGVTYIKTPTSSLFQTALKGEVIISLNDSSELFFKS